MSSNARINKLKRDMQASIENNDAPAAVQTLSEAQVVPDTTIADMITTVAEKKKAPAKKATKALDVPEEKNLLPMAKVIQNLFTNILSKKDIDTATESVIDLVQNGDVAALKVFFALHDFEKMIKAIKEEIKRAAIDEAEKHGPQSHTVHMHNFTVTSSSTYSYKHCEAWVELNKQIKNLEEKLKLGYIDVNTGEEIFAEKSSTTSIRVNYKA